MDADELLTRLAGLPFPHRQQQIAEIALTRTGEPGWSQLLTDLLARGPYERRVLLLLASVTRDLDTARAATTVGSPAERARARRLAVHLGLPVDELVAQLPGLGLADRHDLARTARRHPASGLADALLPAVRAAFGDPDAAALLPACSADVVARELAGLDWAVTGWGGLGHRHPGVALDHVDRLLAATPRALWAAELERVGTALAAAAPHEPARVLDVLEACAPDVAVPARVRRRYATLARHDPARTLALLARAEGPMFQPGRALGEALLPLPDEALGRLAARSHRHLLAAFLRPVPPRRRAAVFAAAVPDDDPDVPLDVLDLLPWPTRHAVARRLLARPDVDPEHRLALTARLPFAEAEPVLAPVVREPRPERRALGHRLLLTAAAGSRDPAVIERVVTGLTRLRNEQDPVRVAAVQRLAAVPAALLTGPAATAAAGIVADAVAARDASWRTRSAAQRLASGLLRAGLTGQRDDLVEAGFAAVAALGDSRDTSHLGGLARALPRTSDQRVVDVLAPRFAAEARTGEFATLLALVDGLGTTRAARLPLVQDHLAAATRAKQDWIVRRAVTLWLAAPATRDERVERVLRRDRSTITLDVVAQAVAARRTDLLGDVLRRTSRGRFLTRNLVFLPPVGRWWHRWTSAQVGQFAAVATALAADTDVAVGQRLAGLRELGSLPGVTPALRRLSTDADVVVAEAALRELGGAEEPAPAVPVLLDALVGDRARVAVPALRACLQRLPRAEVAAPVQAMLTAGKVTVRKDAVRLAVDLATPDAVGLLARVWNTPGEHRDVRRAVPPALRDRLDDPRAWAVLEAAVADPGTASAVLDVAPVGVPPEHRRRWAQLVLAVVTAPDDAVALTALDALERWVRHAPAEAATVLVDVVTDLVGTARWRPAVPLLVQAATILSDVGPLVDAARRLAEAADGPADPDAAPDRDRPVRQRLAGLAEGVAHAGRPDAELRDRLAPLVDLLAAREVTRDLAVTIAVASIGWDTHAGPTAGLARTVTVADTAVLATRAAGALRAGLQPVVVGLPAATLDAATGFLAASTSTAAPYLRLAVVAAAGGSRGWSSRWRDELRELRRHPDPDVARAAANVVSTPE